MKIYNVSDLHNEIYQENNLLQFEGDLNGVLVVAGDINSKGRSIKDLEEVADRWKAIVAVAGNHDYWGIALHETHKFKSWMKNIHFLVNDSIEIDNVVFYGTTLWTDLSDPLVEWYWDKTMNDAKKIRGSGYKKLWAKELQREYLNNKAFVQRNQAPVDGKTKVLVTHHHMCTKSINEKYKHEPYANSYYVTEIPELLEGYDYHFCGHMHNKVDYEVYGCNVKCDPFGYPDEVDDFKLEYVEV